MKIRSYLSSIIAIASVGLLGNALSVSGETEFPSKAPVNPNGEYSTRIAPTPTTSPPTESPTSYATTAYPTYFDECPCRYLKYEFRFNYDLTCDDTTFGGETYCEMPDSKPSADWAESFLIEEFDEDGSKLRETELLDPSSWKYWRIEAHELTRKFRITIVPEHDEGEEATQSIVEFFVFESNTCQEDSLPTFRENDTIGWVVIKEVKTPYRVNYSGMQCKASASPSDSPSVAPSPSPTVCKDDKKYRYQQNKKKDCNWVGRQLKKEGKENMCEDIPSIRDACPLTCGSCCADSAKFFYKKKKKDCNWVRKQVEKKGNNKICDKEYDGIIVKDACRVACGVCSN